jgi:hypothetical protein
METGSEEEQRLQLLAATAEKRAERRLGKRARRRELARS